MRKLLVLAIILGGLLFASPAHADSWDKDVAIDDDAIVTMLLTVHTVEGKTYQFDWYPDGYNWEEVSYSGYHDSLLQMVQQCSRGCIDQAVVLIQTDSGGILTYRWTDRWTLINAKCPAGKHMAEDKSCVQEGFWV